ncbi:MAG: ComEC/Rec2 family competence protein [Flavobacteriales bacterium]
MRKIWMRAPLLRVGIPLVLGVVFQLIWPVKPIVSTVILICCLSLLAFAIYHPKMKSIRFRGHQGLVYATVFAGTGCWVGSMTHPAHHPFHYLVRQTENCYYDITLISEPKVNAYYTSVECEVNHISPNLDYWMESKGKLLLQFKTDSITEKLEVADRMIIRVDSLQKHQQPPYEGAFDYGKYLIKKGIYRRVELKSGKWQMLPEKDISWKQHFVFFRKRITGLLDRYNVPKARQGVIEALIWGKKDELDKDLLKEFSDAGVVHILAVSGLHVGLVYVVISYIVFSFFKANRGRWPRFIFTTVGLWTYAILTGMSPSVMRASAMFTCLIIVEQFHQSKDNYNILSASAVLLIVLDPSVITETGFHLSYLAVLGIMTMQKPIEGLLFIKNKWLKKLWALTSVSIAAQLSTLPIILYLFHQFPNYFIISNLIIIPIATLVLYFGLAFFAFAWFESVGHLLNNITNSLVQVMIDLVRWMNSWPYSQTENIQITFIQCLLLFPIMIFAFQYLFRKKKYALFALLMCILGYNISSFYQRQSTYAQEHFETHYYKKNYMATLVYQDETHLYHLTESDTSSIDCERQFGALVNHYFTKPLVHHFFPDSISDILIKDRVRIHYAHPNEKYIPACDLLIFRQTHSKAYFTIDSVAICPERQILFQGYWSKGKRKYLEGVLQQEDKDSRIQGIKNSRIQEDKKQMVKQ